MHLMDSFGKRLVRLWGMGTPIPTLPLVMLVTACVALMGLVASYIMHHISLGLGVGLNEIVFIAGIPLVFVYALKFDRRTLFRFRLPPARAFVPLILMTLGAVIVIDYLTWASDQIAPLPEKYKEILDYLMSVSSPQEFAYKIVLLCLLPGFCEELFFRGFAQTSLMQRKGKWFGIISAAVLFGLLHGNPWYFHLYAVLGLFLSWAYAVSGTLIVPIICHTINNIWTLTHHVFETTLPHESLSFATNIIILVTGIILLIAGGALFVRTAKATRTKFTGH